MQRDIFGTTGKPTRQMVYDMAGESGLLAQWLTLWQQGFLTFEEALMGAVVAFGNINAEKEKTIQSMLASYFPPFVIPIKPEKENSGTTLEQIANEAAERYADTYIAQLKKSLETPQD